MNTTTTSDISFAAFMLMRGMKLVSAGRSRGKFEFVFDCNGDEAKLESEYVISEFPRYDAALRQLKRKLYGQ
jgi:hypothetical protein